MFETDDLQNSQSWKRACTRVLAKPFPPDASDFDAATLERDECVNLNGISNWAIMCEEVLDTEHSHVYLRKCYEELRRRGKSDQTIQEMRAFAWHLAGWLNFPMMAWDWCSLDQTDIARAIEWLFEMDQITTDERTAMLAYLKAHQ